MFGASQNGLPIFPPTGDKEAKNEPAKGFSNKPASGGIFGGFGPNGGAPGGPGIRSQGFGASNTSPANPFGTKDKQSKFDATKFPATTGNLKG